MGDKGDICKRVVDAGAEKGLAKYWKDMQMGPQATLVRRAYFAGFRDGVKFEKSFEWRQLFEVIEVRGNG